jgi:hypothetical protein
MSEVIFVTMRDDDRGIVEAQLCDHGPYKGWIEFSPGMYGCCVSGMEWHKDRAVAVERAKQYRLERIKEKAAELARIITLPDIV